MLGIFRYSTMQLPRARAGRPIVISFACLTPAPTHGAGGGGQQVAACVILAGRSGPCFCSIAAKAAWRLNPSEVAGIEFDDRPQGFGHGAVVLIIRQCFQLTA
jgi:hypothetical protein